MRKCKLSHSCFKVFPVVIDSVFRAVFALNPAPCFFFLIPPESYIFAPHLTNRYDAFNSFQRGSQRGHE